MKGELSLPQVLTDAYITGVNESSGLKPNVNAEGGEYIMTPDKSVYEVVGEKHKNGGVNMILPNLTAILSDTKNLTITKNDIKKLEKEYDLKGLSTKDTYADVLDKYSRKIGRTKIVKELEDYITQLDKQNKKTTDKTTLATNSKYIASKIDELNNKKKERDALMSDMFTEMFVSQQKQKPKEEVSEEYVPIVEDSEQVNEVIPQGQVEDSLSEMEVFELGGYVGNVRDIANKYKWSERKVYEHLISKDLLPKYQGGGLVVDYGTNEYQGVDISGTQKANQTAFGAIDSNKALQNLYIQFPTVFTKDKYKDLIEFKDGVPVLKKGVSLNKRQPLIAELQRDMNKQMISSSNRIINDKSGLFSEEDKQKAQTYLNEQTFLEGKNAGARGIDEMLGNFTSGRISQGLSLVNQEELQTLKDAGIYSLQQLKSRPDILENLSETTIGNIDKLGAEIPEGVDFRINSYKDIPEEAEKTEAVNNEVQTEQVKQVIRKTDPIVDDINIKRTDRTNIPRQYWMPDSNIPTPTALQPESLETISLDRVDPIRVGIEPILQKIAEERNFISQQLESLPAGQRAAVLANVVGSAQKTESEAIENAIAQNAQNFANAQQINLAQSNNEAITNANQRLNFEQRSLSGLSKTEQDVFNYLVASQSDYINNYTNQVNLNRLDQLTPNVSLDAFGTGYYLNPQSPFQLQMPNIELLRAMQALNSTRESTKEVTK